MVRVRTPASHGDGIAAKASSADGALASAEGRDVFDLTASIRQAMADRGVKTRELMHHVPRRHVGTFYRILAGKTTDPWTSTVVDLCQAVQIDPDALLEATPPALDPEAAQLLEQAQALTEGDRWLLVDLIRTMRKRR